MISENKIIAFDSVVQKIQSTINIIINIAIIYDNKICENKFK